jgi:prophage antirepressor-like protein
MKTENNSTGLIIQAFDFQEQAVRTVLRDGEPWFVASDVCQILALGNVSQAIKGNARAGALGLEEDEKGVTILDTPGGRQQMTVINESGLYALIFKSRKPEAKKFRRWVTGEVLPMLRKQGAYVLAEAAARDEAAERLESVRGECVSRVRDIEGMSAYAANDGIFRRRLSMERVRALHTLGRLRLDAVRLLWDLESGGQKAALNPSGTLATVVDEEEGGEG